MGTTAIPPPPPRLYFKGHPMVTTPASAVMLPQPVLTSASGLFHGVLSALHTLALHGEAADLLSEGLSVGTS